ncbi:class I adenylate-forming enzyme family protein [Xenorhabdus kozodoii]|uniref:Long-chain-fatty-acid--CoA ligase n=1 Tax=Xenorhabdus kozodoii TaxID=351676 RepID=A0A2D0L5D2_9GAMM|nr:class I adenylate-forming enzyme family protein [Xenorhabdus kozodoii]PHM70607.1 long-chain-fatty-acid--CoA ligase [Xenorhabdus kozodoii]
MQSYIMHSLADIYDELTLGRPVPEIRSEGEKVLTSDRIEYWHNQLIDRKLKHGDRLLLLTAASTESVAIMVAAWHLGVVVSPLPPHTRPESLDAIASDCGACQVVDVAAKTWQAYESAVRTEQFIFRTPPRVTGSDLALIIYSSGSTGVPKGIMLSHANVLSALRSITSYLNLHVDDTLLCAPPLHFDYGLYQVLFGFYVGCRVVLAPQSCNAMQLLKLIKHEQPSVIPLVPALGGGLAKLGNALKQQFDCVRLLTNTGGHLPEMVVQNLKQVFPTADVMLMYGLTESKRALFLPVDKVELKPNSVGKPMPGLEAKVFTEVQHNGRTCLKECEPGEIGMLYVRGSSLMQGYTRADNGAGALIIAGDYRDDNWLSTGDLFSYDQDGDFYFRGREKELIKQAGFCLYPRNLEAITEKHTDVLDCAVVGIRGEDGDEHACLFVRTETSLDKSTLTNWLQQHFDAPYLPRRIEFIDNWPINQNGKVDKKALTQLL